MSLINEALKKAQRQRTAGEVDAAAVPGALAGRGQPRSSKSLALIGGGAVILVAVSVVVTLRLVNQAPPGAAEGRKSGVPEAQSSTVRPSETPDLRPSGSAPAPIARAPEDKAISAPSPSAKPNPELVDRAPSSVLRPPSSDSNPAPPPVVKTEPVTTVTTIPQSTGRPPPATNAPPSAQPRQDTPSSVLSPPSSVTPAALAEQINTFLDAAVIKGALPRGAESRVIMNEKFYRLNEFVDRNLQLRLIKVESNNLTFSDVNGALYVKYF